MAVSGVSLASAANYQNPNDPRQLFLQLAKAINSGDLTGAQQAFAELGQALGTNAGSNNNANNPNDPVSQALAAIGQALQSGDIGGAQQALASLQQAQGGRGHHHHGGHRGNGGSNAAAGTSSSAPATVTPATTGTNVDVTA